MTTPSALAQYNRGVLLARAAYHADQATPEDRIAKRAEYERRRYQERKKKQ